MSTDFGSQPFFLRNILGALPVPIIVSDADATVRFLNGSAEKLLQCTQEVVSRPISAVLTLVNSLSGLSVTELIEHVVHGGSASATAWQADLVTNAGQQVPIQLIASRVTLGESDLAGVTLTLRDRTNEQNTEHELQRLLEATDSEREWFSLVLNSIADEVYFTDTSKRYTYANPAAIREFGHESVQGIAVAKVIEKMVVLRADGSPRPIAEAPPLRALGGEVIRDEEQIVHTPLTGQFRHRRVSAAPVRDRHGRIIGSVSVVRDVTERRRAEAVLQEAARRKDLFLATLSRVLQEALAPTRAAAHLLDAPSIDAEDLKRCRAIISRQVADLSSLLEQLPDVSRPATGAINPAMAPLEESVDAIPDKSASSRTVLIVDPNADAAETLALFLRLSGHTVHVARGGEQALELASRVQPQFALLDIDMPDMSGYELAARIRGEPWGGRMTLFAATDRGLKTDLSEARTTAFYRHFTKPVDPEQLNLVLTALPAHRAAAARLS